MASTQRIPVSFKYFKKYTIHKECIDTIFKSKANKNPELYEIKINSEKCQEKALRLYYEAFYLNPKIRKSFHIRLKPAPKHIRQKILQIPPIIINISDDDEPISEGHTESRTHNKSNSVETPNDFQVQQEQDKQLAATSNNTPKKQKYEIPNDMLLPVSYEEFKKYTYNEEIVDTLFKLKSKGDESIYQKLHNSETEKEKASRHFYKIFYLLPEVRKRIPVRFRPMPRKLKEKLLQIPNKANLVNSPSEKDANGENKACNQQQPISGIHNNDNATVATDANDKVQQLATTSKNIPRNHVSSLIEPIYAEPEQQNIIDTINNRLEKQNNNKITNNMLLPVLYDEFKKYTFHEEVVDSLFKLKCEGNENIYQQLINSETAKEAALRAFYKAFYLQPEIREQIPIRFKLIPLKLKEKLLQIPIQADSIAEADNIIDEQLIEQEQLMNCPAVKDANSGVEKYQANKQQQQPMSGVNNIDEGTVAKDGGNKRTIEGKQKKSHDDILIPAMISQKEQALHPTATSKNTPQKPESEQQNNKIPNNIILPVSYEEFKKYTYNEEIVDTLFKLKSKGDESIYQKLHNSEAEKEKASRHFYKIFYLLPEVRKRIPVRFKPMPRKQKKKFLQIPNKTNLVNCPSGKDSNSYGGNDQASNQQLPMSSGHNKDDATVVNDANDKAISEGRTESRTHNKSNNVETPNDFQVQQEQDQQMAATSNNKSQNQKERESGEQNNKIANNILLPVSYEEFKKCTYNEEIVDTLFKLKSKGDESIYQKLHNSETEKEKASRHFYKIFYLLPEVRKKIPVRFRPMPRKLKEKLLQIPNKANLVNCPSEKDANGENNKACNQQQPMPGIHNNDVATKTTDANDKENFASSNTSQYESNMALTQTSIIKRSLNINDEPSYQKRLKLSNGEIEKENTHIQTGVQKAQGINGGAIHISSSNAVIILENRLVQPATKNNLASSSIITTATTVRTFHSMETTNIANNNKNAVESRIIKPANDTNSNVGHTAEQRNPQSDIKHLQTKKIFNKCREKMVEKFTQPFDCTSFPVTFEHFKKYNQIPLEKILNDFTQQNVKITQICLMDKELCRALSYYYYIKYHTTTTLKEKYPLQKRCYDNLSTTGARGLSANSQQEQNIISKSTLPTSTPVQCLEKATRIFFRSADKCHSLSYLIRTTFGLKQNIIRALLSMTFEEFRTFTHVYGGTLLYTDSSDDLNYCYKYVFHTRQIWPTNLYIKIYDLCKFLQTKNIIIANYSTMLMHISPKFLHWSNLCVSTNFEECLSEDYQTRTGSQLNKNDNGLLLMEYNNYYNRCWKSEKWIGATPLVNEQLVEKLREDCVNNANNTLFNVCDLQEVLLEDVMDISKEQVVETPRKDSCNNADVFMRNGSIVQKECCQPLEPVTNISKEQVMEILSEGSSNNADVMSNLSEVHSTPITRMESVIEEVVETLSEGSCNNADVMSNLSNIQEVPLTPITRMESVIKEQVVETLSEDSCNNADVIILNLSDLQEVPLTPITRMESIIKEQRVETLSEDSCNSADVIMLDVSDSQELPLEPEIIIETVDLSDTTVTDGSSDGTVLIIHADIEETSSQISIHVSSNVVNEHNYVLLPNTQQQIDMLPDEEGIQAEVDPVGHLDCMPILNVSGHSSDNSLDDSFTSINDRVENIPKSDLHGSIKKEEVVSMEPLKNLLFYEDDNNNIQCTPREEEIVSLDDTISENELPPMNFEILNSPPPTQLFTVPLPNSGDSDGDYAIITLGQRLPSSAEADSSISTVYDNNDRVTTSTQRIQLQDVNLASSGSTNELLDDDANMSEIIGLQIFPNYLENQLQHIPSTLDFNEISNEALYQAPALQLSTIISTTPSNVDAFQEAQRLCSTLEDSQTATTTTITTATASKNNAPCSRTATSNIDRNSNVTLRKPHKKNSSIPLPETQQVPRSFVDSLTPTNAQQNVNVIKKPNPRNAIRVQRVKPLKNFDFVEQLQHPIRPLPQIFAQTINVPKDSSTSAQCLNASQRRCVSSATTNIHISQELSTNCTLFNNTSLLKIIDHNYQLSQSSTSNLPIRESPQDEISVVSSTNHNAPATHNDRSKSPKPSSSSSSSSVQAPRRNSIHQDVEINKVNTLAISSIQTATISPIIQLRHQPNQIIRKLFLYRDLIQFHFFKELSPQHIAQYLLPSSNISKSYAEATIVCENLKTRLSNNFVSALFPYWSESLQRDFRLILNDLKEFHYTSFDGRSIQKQEDLRSRILFWFIHSSSKFSHCHLICESNNTEFAQLESVRNNNNPSYKRLPFACLTKSLDSKLLVKLKEMKKNLKT